VPLPIKLDSVAVWEPLAFDDALMAELGAVCGSSADAGILAGIGDRGVRQARTRRPAGRSKPGTFSYNKLSNGNVPGSGLAEYRRQGAHGPASEVIYDARRIPQIASWLEERLGPVTLTSHHDPLAPGGAVRCKITGRLNLVFAVRHDQGENLSDEERQAIVSDDCR
jgi:hypothetical protein